MKNRHYNNFFLILEFTTTMVTLKIIMMMKIIGVITIVKASEDRSHVDDGKWFSDNKIILRTMTVILPVNWLRFLGVVFLKFIFCCSLRHNNDTSPEEKARALSLSKVRCYRSAFLVMFITFPEVSSRILRMLPPACHKICQVWIVVVPIICHRGNHAFGLTKSSLLHKAYGKSDIGNFEELCCYKLY